MSIHHPSSISLLDLLLAAAACVLWYLRPVLGPWPLALAALGRLIRTLTMPHIGWRRTAFDLPLAVFLVSAGLAAWLSYDQAAGRAKFWVIVGGLLLYDSLALAPEEVRLGRWRLRPVGLTVALLPALIAAYFLLTNDWRSRTGKLPELDPLLRWLASWQPALPGHRLHPNVAGGLIAGLLPLQLAAVGRMRAGWPLIGLAAFGLLTTASRGAWVALALGLVGAALWLRARGHVGRIGNSPFLLAAVLLLIAAAATLTLAPSAIAGVAATLADRLALLRNSLDLALDTPFTGVGLASFPMAYSSYVLMLHVPHTVHSHNLFLNLWIEQGLMGLVAFGWGLGAGGWGLGAGGQGPGAGGRWRAAALAALATILVHGMVDDAFYGSRGVLLLFVPFALLARASCSPSPSAPDENCRATPQELPCSAVIRGAGAGKRLAGRAGVLILALVLAAGLLPPARAAFQADLGALLQTRAELSVYRWPAYPIQDALRRQAPGSPPPVDLAPAIARYRAALALDPHNVTANRRLGQIELSLGADEAAAAHLAAAYRAAPGQRANRFLWGESLALAGRTTEAAALWRTVDVRQGQLELRAWWYATIGEPEKAERVRRAAD